MDVRSHNRAAWNRNVENQNPWTIPVSAEVVNRARRGHIALLLTPTKPVPMSWFPILKGTRTLCLASGGGQQGPVLAAAGAIVTVFDNSPRQLGQDRLVADREGITLETVEGDMADLSVFFGDLFDLIVHPCSNCFVPDVRSVWRECFRVLCPGGILMAGFTNPLRYLFDDERLNNGDLQVRHSLPYADTTHLDDADLRQVVLDGMNPLEFGHTLTDQIGGQLDAGFRLTGFFEDRYDDLAKDLLSRYADTFVATRAIKPN
jgi:SAM-dependent methyltransferase